LEIGHRQGREVAKEPRPELDVDAVGRVREQVGPQDAERGLEDRDRQKPDDQHVEGR